MDEKTRALYSLKKEFAAESRDVALPEWQRKRSAKVRDAITQLIVWRRFGAKLNASMSEQGGQRG